MTYLAGLLSLSSMRVEEKDRKEVCRSLKLYAVMASMARLLLHPGMTFTAYVCPCTQVVGDKQQTSRLLLCEATAVVMRQCFDLLGMTPMYQI